MRRVCSAPSTAGFTIHLPMLAQRLFAYTIARTVVNKEGVIAEAQARGRPQFLRTPLSNCRAGRKLRSRESRTARLPTG